MTPYVVCFVTTPGAEVSETLSKTLVSESLCACVNILPGLRSIYRWQGKICDDGEQLLLIKTRRERVPDLIARVRSLHPYEVPEIIALPIETGHEPYLAWIGEMTEPVR